MTSLLLSHPDCLEHRVPHGHPERPARITALLSRWDEPRFDKLLRAEAPLGSLEQAGLAHSPAHVARIAAACPDEGLVFLDADTVLSPGSLDAALRGVGAAIAAVDAVVGGQAHNAFCAIRPPGHHAETARAMGFCLFNTAAIAARYSQRSHGLERIAIVDWDVHHGNGTQEIFWSDPSVLYASTHEAPLFPGTGAWSETGESNTIVNVPLRSGDGSVAFQTALDAVILPRVEAFAPSLIVISAGFDAHANDPLGSLNLTAEDFALATRKLMEIADRHCEGRIVSVLEGGYDLDGLADSAAAHVEALMSA